MGTLIGYVLLALASLAVLAAIDNTVKHHYIDPIVAKDEVKLKDANDRADKAEQANQTLSASIQGRVDACNARADEFEDKSKKAESAASDAVRKASESSKALQATLKALRAKASGPSASGDVCAQADAILSDLAIDVRAALGLVTISGPHRTTGAPQ